MTRGRWAERADALVEAVWLVAAGLVLLVAPPYVDLGLEAGRWLLVRPLAALAVGSALAAAWLRRGDPSPRLPSRHDTGTWPIRLAAAAWGLAVAVASFASVDPLRSFWGEPPRLAGALSLAAPFALFWVAAPRLASESRRERLATALLSFGAALASWALLERLGLDVLALERLDPTRVAGPQGNPIFLGACLAALAPLALARALDAARRGRRAAAGAAAAIFALEALAAGVAGARGPLAGLVLGSALVALGASASRGRKRLLAGALAGTVAALLAATLALPAGDGPFTRLRGLADGTPGTATQRLLLWRGTLSLLAADPLRAWIGHGPETLRRVLPPHLPEELPGLFFFPDLYHDRAHDLLLDEAAANGWPAALALFALLTFALGRALAAAGVRTGGSTAWRHAATSAGLAALAVALAGGLGRWELAVPGASLAPVAAAFLMVLASSFRAAETSERPATALLPLGIAGALAAGQIESATGLRTAATWTLFFLLAAAVAWPAGDEAADAGSGEDRESDADDRVPPPAAAWLVALVPAAALFSAWTPARVGGPSPGAVAALAALAALAAALAFARPLARWSRALRLVGPYALLHLLLIGGGARHLAITACFALGLLVLVVGVGAGLEAPRSPRRGARRESGHSGGFALAVVALLAPPVLVGVGSWRWIEAGVALGAGRTELAQGNVAPAEQAFAAAAAAAPEITAPELELARLRMRRAGSAPAAERDRLFAEALASLDRAAARHPLDAEWRLQGGLLLARWAEASAPDAALRRRDAAIERLREGLALEPTSAPLWRALGAVQLDAERLDEAIADLRAAVQRAPRSAEGRLLLARAWLAGGEWQAAIDEARRALAVDRARVVRVANGVARSRPDDAMAQLDVALVAAADGDRSGVALALERARAVAGPGDRRHVEVAARAFRAALGESP